ncbi:MAG TPA: pyridoxal-phosphate dependent enzyme, partial [Actinomycetota bacterium]|nr:pyridoxal-phosphate dependent enzyme [Actinomycetota bacterium]
MEVLDTFLDAVGHTPLVRLRRVADGVSGTVLAKLEMLNPGGSVKDRIGLRMIEAAEREGHLKPGGTIVEPTSGNTGHGLAIAAAIRGYRCIFVMPDKMSQEKVALLRAYGAEVIITPTAVAPESPESYYKVADRLTEEIPGAFQPNQYYNQGNPQAHYETTGPELWEQTEGRIDVLVAGVGTGGTITGTGRYLKERKREVMVVGADPEGSVFSAPDEPARPYLVEGIGEDFWPETFDPSVVDRYVRVSDRDSFLLA